MDAILQFRNRSVTPIDDLVATFVEQELGRHDWSCNWAVYKVRYPDYLERIRGFFHRLGEDVDPKEVARHIENMIVQRPGRWR